LHGWEFEIDNGRCLTSDDRKLVTRPASPDGADAQYPRIPEAEQG
jgi:UDP-MurNAc hydroxylase